jgi:protein-S-isoprenylcysteine O-methyltransferase Ste14
LIIQKRQNIDAFKLGKGKKNSNSIEKFVRISTLIWGITWFLEIIYSKKIEGVIKNIFNSDIMKYTGLLLGFSGLIIFFAAMTTMRNSWRVGIDKEIKTEFVNHGIYKYSRNPAFVGFDLMFTGLFFTYSNWIVLLVAIVNIIGLDLLIKKEEEHLCEIFGEEYTEYKKEVKRYIGFNLKKTKF